MTTSTDEEILDEYGIAPEADSSPDKHGELRIPHVTGGVDRDRVGDDDDSTMYANDAVATQVSTSTRVRRVIGDDAGMSMDASPGERGSAQLHDVVGRPSSSADSGGTGIVETGWTNSKK